MKEPSHDTMVPSPRLGLESIHVRIVDVPLGPTISKGMIYGPTNFSVACYELTIVC
jgi:hypothetical protein